MASYEVDTSGGAGGGQTGLYNASYGRPARAYEGTYLGPRRPRQVTDYGSSIVQWMRVRRPPWKRNGSSLLERERPSMSYVVDMLPPYAAQHAAVDSIPVRHLHHSVGKSKKPITVVRWTPEGRRLLTGGHTGEFMLWNGMAFNFETVMDAHYDQYKAGVTSAEWSWNRDWLISGGQKGDIKYWRPNFNNVETIDDAHHDAVRCLAWCPSDTKFLSASDDTTLKIFDFNACQAELVLTGHGWDVKACDWHPRKGLLVSGSKDHQVKFWDPRAGRCLTTLHTHKNTVTATRFSRVNANLLATASRDTSARVFDLRMMRDICVLRGNKAPVSSLTWHPIHPTLVSTGSEDGALAHYLLDEPHLPAQGGGGSAAAALAPYDTPRPAAAPAQTVYAAHRIERAHDATVWSLDWHPLGHILASGSKDTNTHFWARARPGEVGYATDAYHLGKEAAEESGGWAGYGRGQAAAQAALARREEEQEAADEAEGLVDQKRMEGEQGIPGLIPGIGAPQRQPSAQPTPPQPPAPQMAPVPPGTTQPPPFTSLPPPPPGLANIDPSRLAALLASGAFGATPPPPQPPPPGTNPVLNHPGAPPPPPGFTGHAQLPFLPPPPPGLQAMMGGGVPGLPGLGGGQQQGEGTQGGLRRRGPLPSQQDQLVEEQRRRGFRSGR